jgi:hypothetical protein
MTTPDYIMNFGLIALVLLQIRGHKVTRARLVFPLVTTIFGAAQFLHAIPTAGSDLVLIVVLVALGAALGAGAGFLTTVRLDGANAFAKAGLVVAVLWIVGIGARMGFALWADVYDDDHEELQACEANPASGSALGRMPCTMRNRPPPCKRTPKRDRRARTRAPLPGF